jgi:hypothetical protein
MALCPKCEREEIGVTLAGKLRFHKANGERCDGSGLAVKEEGPSCTPPDTANSATCSSTSDTGDQARESPPRTPSTTTKKPTTNSRAHAQSEASAPPAEPTDSESDTETLPGANEYARDLAAYALASYVNPPPWVEPTMYEDLKAAEAQGLFDQPSGPLVDPVHPTLFSQPSPPEPTQFAQPSPSAASARKAWAETQPMSALGAEIAHRLKEMFHGYSNRMERNQQPTLGPSEIGTPCDRRIALSLLRKPTVNPGGDGWASFVGTCIHAGLEEMLMWADAGSGRYAVEQRLEFPSPHVPKGTTDLIDRTLLLVGDHKGMGQWSLDKLKREGPSRTYRIQAHTYAYGATIRGEVVKHVAIIGWPRDKSSLDDLYVWTEPYDPDLARDALKRVDKIAKRVLVEGGEHEAYALPFDNTDCRFCPFYMKKARTSEGGVCNGRT